MSRLITASLALCLTSLTACGDDDRGAAPSTSVEREALAQTIAATAVDEDGGEIGSIAQSIALFEGEVLPGLQLDVEGRFFGYRGGFELFYDVDCQDAFGVPTACGPAASSARIEASWTASVSLPRRTAEARYDGRWTVERLADGRYRVDGRGDLAFDGDFASASGKNTKTTDLSWAANYEALIIAPQQNRRPVDGQVVYAIEIERTHDTPGRARSETVDIDAILSFDGADAHLVVDRDAFRVDTRADGRMTVRELD